jgi:hypothetical protein
MFHSKLSHLFPDEGIEEEFFGSTKRNGHLPDESQTGPRDAGDFRSMVRADWSFQSKTGGP